MPKGRKVDPTRARRGTGHRRAAGDPKVASEPAAILLVGKSGPPPAPAGLEHPHAVEVWDRVVSELYPRGLRPVDYEAVRLLSSQAAVAYQAAAELRESDGLVILSDKGAPIANPLVKIERDAATLYLRFAERFGLDVASRMRLGLLQLAGQSLADALQDDLERD